MRTSRVSRETSRLVQALSTPRRQTRSSLAAASALRNFSYSDDKVDPELSDDSSLSSAKTEDIEDLLEEPAAKRRRRNADTPSTSISTVSTTDKRVKREVIVKKEVTVKTEEVTATTAKSTNPKQRRQPAKKIKREDGSVEVQPPSNWETMYGIVKKMRAANPTAPVDTMGCADLHWRTSPPKEQRFHTLIALMLSSQTKDTVTAPVMQRLHTELGPEEEQNPTSLSPSKTLIKKEEEDDDKDGIKLGSPPKKGSTLTVENIIAVSPERLNQIIWAVGFHNNKTKYIKQVAEILRDQYDSDIPSTPEELMKLPGVGPKMAYLCMSAAWGKHEGIGVDVHVHRITNLWGWHVTKNPEETRIALQSWLPRDKWHEINKLLVGLGQTACLPVGRKCGECDLAGTGLCKSEIRGMVVKTKREVKEEAKVKIETV